MRVLVATTAGLGHFGPLLPFAAACRRAGHDVLVAAPASFAPEVERARFAHRPFADVAPEEWGAVMSRLPDLGYEESEKLVLAEVFAGANVRAALPGVLSAVEEWSPHVVLRETAELASHLAAERFGVPEVRVAVALGLVEGFALDVFAEALVPVRAELGLDGDAADRLRAARSWTLVPPSFEYPDSARVGADRYRGGDDDGPPTPLPPWWAEDLSDLPLVYVTFGTVATTVPAFGAVLPVAVRAVADLPVRVLVTVGQSGNPEVLAGLPANVHVERWVAQAEVLPHASAVVCHGGFGSVMGPLKAGVPLVVVPQFADQPYNAARVAAVGAGVALPLGPPDPGAVREAVNMLLGEPRYLAGAAALAEEIRGLPPVDEAVSLLDSLSGNAERP
ncbi:MAG: glycosyltransferase [Actinomycetota bacterium]|nr:glycosyltransferase [Actinomycetota bacterium]